MESKVITPWQPDAPTSKGADAYHEAVVEAQYYVQILQDIINLVRENIKEDEIVVDFGAGTGVSAQYLLKNYHVQFKLWLVDNSAAWLGKAFDVFKDNPNVQCYLLKRIQDKYQTLAEVIGSGVADHVMSANTLHLIPNIQEVFDGINGSLKQNGTFTFESGNIKPETTEEGAVLVDDTVKEVHDIAIDLVKEDDEFAEYRDQIEASVEATKKQRKFVFPDPRPVSEYLQALKSSGFKVMKSYNKMFKIKYKDWLEFLRVKRLQAGILPEIGGMKPTPKQEEDRDKLITKAANILFDKMRKDNPLADQEGFTIDIVYVAAIKL